MALRSFCVIIPMYNEERGAENCVRSVSAALELIPYRNALLVVNDGSSDKTGEILERLAPQFPRLHVVSHAVNMGYGAALRTGVRKAAQAAYEYAVFMDSDLTKDPSDLPRFVQKMEEDFDLIKASRYVGDGRTEGVPWKRRAISATGNAVARILFGMGLHDCTNGFRAVKLGILTRMNLRERGFPIIMEELYQSRFLVRSCCEIPVVLTSRAADMRPTSFGYNPETFKRYLGFGLKAFFRIKPDLQQGDSD